MAATSLDVVEAASGVGRSQLYHYFDDRDDLLRAVAAATADGMVERSSDLLAGLDSFDGIRRWLDMAAAVNAANGAVGGCPIGSLVGQLAEHDDATRQVLADGFARWEQPLIDGLTAIQRRGEIKAGLDVELLADQVFSLMQGGLLLAQVRRDPAQLRRALDGALALVDAARVAAA